MVKAFKLALLLVVLTATLVACSNSDNDEGSTDSQISSEDELASVLDVFSIEDAKVPFMEVQENSEGELFPQTAGYFEDGQYIVDGMGGHDLDNFETMSLDEVTAEIDSIVSEIDVPVGSRSVIEMDYTVEPYYEPLHVFKYTSPTDSSESLQIPIFFTMPNVMTGNIPTDMNEAQLDNFVRTERDNRFLTDTPTSSMDVKLHGEGSDSSKNTTAYLTSFSINDPVQFLEDTTRTERESIFPVFRSADASKYESWVEIRPDANERGGTRSLLIYKTPEVIETLNLDSDSGLVNLTDEDDGDKVYVHVINE